MGTDARRSRSRSASPSRKSSSRRHSRHSHHSSSSRRHSSSRHSSRSSRRSRSRERHSRRGRRSHSRSRSRSRSRSASRERSSRHRKRSRDEGDGRSGRKKREKTESEEAKQPPVGESESAPTDEQLQKDAVVTPVTAGSGSSAKNGMAVDPLAVAAAARKLIDEAKAALSTSDEPVPATTSSVAVTIAQTTPTVVAPPAAPAAPAVDVSSIKLDILKALAEARSTIAEIKGEAPGVETAAEDANPAASDAGGGGVNGQQQQQQPDESKAESPKKQENEKAAIEAASSSAAPPAPAATPAAAGAPEEAVDEFDMFSMAELDDATMPASLGVSALTVTEASMQANCDDAEGYYTTTVGEVLNGTYRVLGVVGKGVFSTVLRCARVAAPPPSSAELDVVAIKLIRNNEVMRDAAQTEIRLLRELAERDPRDKKHCVRLLDTFEHRGHTALVFEPMQMNVREAMKKFGGKGGISIQAVRVFSKHLLIALSHLEACAVVHAGTYVVGLAVR